MNKIEGGAGGGRRNLFSADRSNKLHVVSTGAPRGRRQAGRALLLLSRAGLAAGRAGGGDAALAQGQTARAAPPRQDPGREQAGRALRSRVGMPFARCSL